MTYINPFEVALKQLEIVAKEIDLNEDFHERLKHMERIMIVSIPIRMDTGKLKIFQGYRVQHSTIRGPAKGGIRYDLGVNLDEVKALSMWMTWKTSLLKLPLGGAKGGVQVNPNELSHGELERLSRRYAVEILNIIGPTKDIPAPDMNTDAQTMAWIMDTYSMFKGETTPGVVTGKPVEIGGSLGRTRATGMGLFFIAKSITKKLGLNLSEMKVVVQGFGKVGKVIAEELYNFGCKIICVCDITAGVYSESGLNIHELAEWVSMGNNLKDYEGTTGELIPSIDVLTLDCDILVPAATENQITKKNADKIKTKIVLEGANGPTTPEADEILNSKGIVVVPDILANSGGVLVSYFEYIQDINAYFWDIDRINQELGKVLQRTFEEVYKISQERKISLRTAAYIIAVSGVAKALELRGLYP
ncbi:MAG: Glu/Leu/Phe/Val dehydrogenase [Candidatus Lokiarchaeota archaeon]|nr:Glu/Leu/Phe/Val dehydrogenase [Candidatus Lokiarchaeota archaeon]